MSCAVGRRRSSDPALLWFWHRLAATALIRPLAWEPPYATGVALTKDRKKKLTICLFTHSDESKNEMKKVITLIMA